MLETKGVRVKGIATENEKDTFKPFSHSQHKM